VLFRFVFLSFLFSLSLFGGVLSVGVAANVSYAFPKLLKEFNKLHPDTKVRVVLGSSGKLTAQIKNGADFALFMSANMKYPQSLYKDGFATTKPIVYAQGALALFSVKKLDFSKGLELLKGSSISTIAIANPKTAPYGTAAMEAVKNAKLFNGLKRKFVYAESISQCVSYVVSATDVGFVAKSSMFSPKMSRFKKGVNWVEVDELLYTPIKQGMVLLKTSKEAKAFYDFILSNKAKKIFGEFGYTLP